jgi:hypothetical protein
MHCDRSLVEHGEKASSGPSPGFRANGPETVLNGQAVIREARASGSELLDFHHDAAG